MGKGKIVWSIKELTEVLRQRQLNKFDVCIGVSGKRGNGKSTLLFHIFNSFKKHGFNQNKHQVYSRNDVMDLLSSQTFGFCWDDEAVNSGYKRDFQNTGQKELIKIVTNYRDSHNIYASSLPFFYSLDKDLRELIFCHIHIVERGVGIILLPLADQIHGSDPWDTMNNIKIEQKENQRIKRNPNAPFRYTKLTTFAGYIYFGPMTKRQEEIYSKIKKEKRAKNFGREVPTEEMDFQEKLLKLLTEGKLTKDGLIQACLIEGKSFSGVVSELNRKLKDKGDPKTVSRYYREVEIKGIKLGSNNQKSKISSIVPTIQS